MKFFPSILTAASIFTATLLPARAGAEDVVFLTPPQPGAPATRLIGTVRDYSGQGVRIDLKGVERVYPAQRVQKIESPRVAEHDQAREAVAEGDFARAVPLFHAANRQETRVWMRRWMLAELTACYQGLDQFASAGDTFLLLAASDPSTPYFACIPLAWNAFDSVPKDKAEAWLAHEDLPSAQLLGASHLLSTDRRSRAVEALKKLTTIDDANIASLATAQLWRAEAFRATLEQTGAWEAQLAAMPEPLRAGPYFILGLALAKQKNHEAAALALLRVPVLYAENYPVSAAALVAAGDALAALGRQDQAVRLWREVQQGRAITKSRADAKLRLRQTTP